MLKKVFDISIDLRIRIFYVLMITGMTANCVGFFANAMLFGEHPSTIICGICFIAIVILSIFGIVKGKQELATCLIMVIITVIEFPMLFYYYGRSTMLYMLLPIVTIATFVSKKWRLAVFAVIALYDMAVFYIMFQISDIVQSIGISNYMSAVCTFVIVSCASYTMVSMLAKQHEMQNEELLREKKMLQVVADLDMLTQVYNRRYLTQYLEMQMENPECECCVAMLDLDDFKKVNDVYGHTAGDLVLKVFADQLQKMFNDDGIVARYGGEEFIVVFMDSNTDRFMAMFKRVQEEFRKFSLNKFKKEFSFSGGAIRVKGSMDLVRMFDEADKYLYEAKKTGKNKIVLSE